MGSKEFIEKCKEIVRDYTNEHLNQTDKTLDDVFIVWSCKTLQNMKAILGSKLLNGIIYEVTYNGDKKEIYFDAYKKFENRCIKLEEE